MKSLAVALFKTMGIVTVGAVVLVVGLLEMFAWPIALIASVWLIASKF